MSRPWENAQPQVRSAGFGTGGSGFTGSGFGDPFGGGARGADPFGSGWGLPAPAQAAPAPAAPPRPRSAPESPVFPGRLFAVNQLLGLTAALLVSTAAATLLAQPELHYCYRTFTGLTMISVGVSASAAALAVGQLALAFGIRRRLRAGWPLVLADAVLLAAAAGATLVMRPGAQVGWFAMLSGTTAALTGVVAAAILVLTIPARNWFAGARDVRPGGAGKPRRFRLPKRSRSSEAEVANATEATVVLRTMAPQGPPQLPAPFPSPAQASTPDPFDFNPFG